MSRFLWFTVLLQWFRVLHWLDIKIGHFQDVLPSQSLSTVPKKLNL